MTFLATIEEIASSRRDGRVVTLAIEDGASLDELEALAGRPVLVTVEPDGGEAR